VPVAARAGAPPPAEQSTEMIEPGAANSSDMRV
jgi:hypothetical protein